MAAGSSLTGKWDAAARRVSVAETQDFAELIKVGGLDPKRHLRFADWSQISFRGSDLRGFDFTGARLIGCDFTDALIKGACFDQAEIHHRDEKDLSRTNLRSARDWAAYVKTWARSPSPPKDDHFTIGTVFQDAAIAPEMVVLPPGEVILGRGQVFNENAACLVEIPVPFAVSRFPVTFEEWDAARKKNRNLHSPLRPDQSSRFPVTDVSWNDAKAYVTWLSTITGKPYRLLSEAEWEYCAQAGPLSHPLPLLDPLQDVETLSSNSIGIHGMHAMTSEWCEDIWHPTFENSPPDGSSRLRGDDAQFRVLRTGIAEADAESGFVSRIAVKQSVMARAESWTFRVARRLAF